jgi:hypothetical protein
MAAKASAIVIGLNNREVLLLNYLPPYVFLLPIKDRKTALLPMLNTPSLMPALHSAPPHFTYLSPMSR